MNLKKKEPN